MSTPVFVLGGYQTDFATNWSRQGDTLYELMSSAVTGGLAATRLEPSDVGCIHVGNFTGELFSGQGHLGGFVASMDPAFAGLPSARHEAACASGSTAILAASADIEAGRYDLACVVGVEQMRTVDGQSAADHLGAAAWRGREAQEARFLWPFMFSELAEEYDRRFGVDYAHLMAISKLNYDNGRRNPNAQTRKWDFTDASFSEDFEANPPIEGRIRRQDCAQITDGAAVVFLASASFAERYATKQGRSSSDIPRLLGWGHRTAPMLLADKLAASADQPVVFPHVAGAINDARERANLGVGDIDGAEVHDCFTITEYMIIDHFGLTEPGKPFTAIDDGTIAPGGKLPFNASGGLIGLGHPVGATGVRMVLDCYKQVTGAAGDYQIGGAKRMQTVNIGGSATTTVSFVVGC